MPSHQTIQLRTSNFRREVGPRPASLNLIPRSWLGQLCGRLLTGRFQVRILVAEPTDQQLQPDHPATLLLMVLPRKT